MSQYQAAKKSLKLSQLKKLNMLRYTSNFRKEWIWFIALIPLLDHNKQVEKICNFLRF